MFRKLNPIALFLILAISFAANSAQGATSYLLIQGEFDAGSAGLETYKWKVDYIGSTLVTGQDLLDAVFGTPALVTGTTYMAGNNSHGVRYTSFSFGYSPQQFFASGFAGPLTPNPFTGNYWAYFNAGGYYVDYTNPVLPVAVSYSDIAWGYANTGGGDRLLKDNDGDANLNEPSFDAYVFGDGNTTPSGSPIDYFSGIETPFSSGTGYNVYSIASAPEPSRSVLLLFAGIALASRRRRSIRTAC